MAKQRSRPSGASLAEFRDTEILHRLAESANGHGVTSIELADLLGFAPEEGASNVGVRLAWMKSWGMVAFDKKDRTWALTRGADRVIEAQRRAPELVVVDELPDELMVEAMAHVTSRFQRGDTMLGHMLRREFQYGTQRWRRR
jgi:hypothetical protein